MKNSNDTRNLPTCSAVPQPTALRRAPFKVMVKVKVKLQLTDSTSVLAPSRADLTYGQDCFFTNVGHCICK
jgi:hypothetical protein